MRVTVTLYGGLQDIVGARSREVIVADDASARAVVDALVVACPALAPRLAQVALARGDELVPGHAPMRDGDELGLLPPVCGG